MKLNKNTVRQMRSNADSLRHRYVAQVREETVKTIKPTAEALLTEIFPPGVAVDGMVHMTYIDVVVQDKNMNELCKFSMTPEDTGIVFAFHAPNTFHRLNKLGCTLSFRQSGTTFSARLVVNAEALCAASSFDTTPLTQLKDCVTEASEFYDAVYSLANWEGSLGSLLGQHYWLRDLVGRWNLSGFTTPQMARIKRKYELNKTETDAKRELFLAKCALLGIHV